MALRMIGRRAARLASAATRPLVPAAASARASPSLGASALQIQTRSFAKAKKVKGGKGKPAPVVDDDDDDAGDEEDGGAAKALEKANKNMNGAVVNFTRALSQMRPGRADAGIFDELHVPAYGQHVPLAQVAQVAVAGTHALSVTVYDPSLMPDVKKAIEGTNAVYSVREDVSSLEISFPKMSKETRADLLKATKKQAEQARQHVRRVRQDAMNHAKKLKDAVSEDDVEVQKERIQKATDSAIAEIDKLLAAKEKDLNTV
ncbi:Ribosome recycling factor domain-containing protein [Phytophthora infestans]|nr:Ribosome recycling factor domain-containing protein [Phytophthora infestans]KAF4128448.1 Ribosome recycling factor domain-containing protein [Phytophthora infestans]